MKINEKEAGVGPFKKTSFTVVPQVIFNPTKLCLSDIFIGTTKSLNRLKI